MKKYAVIVAGGIGNRMGSALPKQFLLLKGKTIIQHTIEAFQQAFDNIEIILVLPQDHIQTFLQLHPTFLNKLVLVNGGPSRFDSVKNGLQKVEPNSLVAVHDAVRCLVTPSLIQNCFQHAQYKGSAVPCVSVVDSIRLKTATAHQVLNRDHVKVIQTPQTFHSNILLDAFQQTYQASFTDEATVVESFGKTVDLIEGDYENIKITRPLDLMIAESILTNRTIASST